MSKAAVELDSGEKIPVVDFSGLTDRDAAMRAATAAGMRAAFRVRRSPRSFRLTAGEHLAARRRETTRSGYQD